ncbi:MAG: S46 family peptidase, partial [Tenuifilaceae bacterium]|nr:S46 family peptidase [Tenuifilaceae bacterium]
TLGDTMAPHRHKLSMAYKTINKGYLEMDSDKTFYPDANSTMRLSYGKVIGYNPLDGVVMHPNTYLRGVMEKGNSNVDVFKVSSKLKELYANKDYANYADSIGVPICFLTDNDITNGNSGSPVLNANGNLVGVAFDGNQEAMACDFMFEPHMQRTISVDIRYVLFVIDKYANAKRLIDEMTLITD